MLLQYDRTFRKRQQALAMTSNRIVVQFSYPEQIDILVSDIALGQNVQYHVHVCVKKILFLCSERRPPSPSPDGPRLRWRKDQTQWRQSVDQTDRSVENIP